MITISSLRSGADDESGDDSGFPENAGHTISRRTVVPDDVDEITAAVTDALGWGVDAVITTVGAGITPDDVTVEALRPHFTREIGGFGEEFRRLSKEQVGLAGLLSRTTAGVISEAPVFALPGSENAIRLGVEELVLPELDHILYQVRR